MSDEDHERIFLEPPCCSDYHGDGRQWCQDDVWSYNCEHGKKPTEYVRADLYERLRAENEALKVKYDRITQAVKGMIVLGETEPGS